MAVGPVSSSNGYIQSAQTEQTSTLRQRRQDFDALSQALSSGDLSGAKSAFAAIQQDVKAVVQSQSSQQTETNSHNRFQAAIEALKHAFSSNDLSAAQSAFSTLQQLRERPPPQRAQENANAQAASSSIQALSAGISIKA